jgi:hypothetical protein
MVIVRMGDGRGAFFVKFAIELVASRRKRVEPGNAFEVDEVVGLLSVLEGKLQGAAPAVRFRAKIGDFADSPAQETRHGGRNFLCGNAVDGDVTFVAPRDRSPAL